MDFITQSWKNIVQSNIASNVNFIRVFTCFAVFCMSLTAQASDIYIEFATSTLFDHRYQVDAFIDYKFDDEVLTAMTNGVPLRLDTHIKIKRERKWLWDPVVRSETVSFQLQRHALGDHYLLTNLTTEHMEQFQYLDEALRTLGSIKDHFLFDELTINAEANYIGFIKSELNIEALPPPLRLSAYFSSHWRASSPWYEWLVK